MKKKISVISTSLQHIC